MTDRNQKLFDQAVLLQGISFSEWEYLKSAIDAVFRKKKKELELGLKLSLDDDLLCAMQSPLACEALTAQHQHPEEQPLSEMRANIKKADNKEILRRQLELLAEYSHRMMNTEKIPDASQAMMDIYKTLTQN